MAFLACAITMQSQTNYFVSTSGSNGNNGLSIANAWRTIQHAMDNTTPNSIVNILAGTYAEKVEVNVSGTAGNPIVFQNYNNDIVTITGTGINAPDAIIGIFDQSYIHIKGLKITDNQQLDAQGIIVEGNCRGIEIRNNEFSNIHFSTNPNEIATSSKNSQPIIVYGSNASNPVRDLVIDGNIVRDSRTGYSEGLAINGNVDGFVVSNNEVYNISNIGIDIIGHEQTATANDQARNGIINDNLVYNCKSPYAIAAGIYVDGGKDLVIERNVVYDCQWGIEVGCENIGKTTSTVIVRDNLIYHNEDSGISLGGYNFPSESGKVLNCKILNNTCYNNDYTSGGLGGVTGEVNVSYTENCQLKNNIFYTAAPSDILLYVGNTNSIGLDMDYNLYFIQGNVEFEYEGSTYSSLMSYKNSTGQDLHSIFTIPKFVSTTTPDFQLESNSPAIDIGDPSFTLAAGETDFGGNQRVKNAIVDIGAYEYQVQPCPSTLTLSNTISAGTYSAGGLLTVNGIISTNGSIRFEARCILLTNNFHAPNGSDFTAIITPCVNSLQRSK